VISLWLKLFHYNITIVATLALGLQPRQGLTKARAKREAWESRFMLPKVQENVRE